MKHKREIIFDMPETHGKYRVVCRFGYDSIVYYAWWGHLQKQYRYKLWPWSKPRFKWFEIDECWWSTNPLTMEQKKPIVKDNWKEENYKTMYNGKSCTVIASHKVWRRIKFETGKKKNVLYNEIPS